MDNKPIISPDSSIQERLQAMKQNREKGSNFSTPIPSTKEEDNLIAKSEKRLKVERLTKDITVEVWQDMHYAIKNIASRFRKSEKDIIKEAIEDGLKRKYKERYQEFLDEFKKIFG